MNFVPNIFERPLLVREAESQTVSYFNIQGVMGKVDYYLLRGI